MENRSPDPLLETERAERKSGPPDGPADARQIGNEARPEDLEALKDGYKAQQDQIPIRPRNHVKARRAQ